MSNKTENNNLSGESIALGFVSLGLIYAYVMPDLFSIGTPYVAAALILLGFAGFMIELQKRFNTNGFHWDNGGVGMAVGVITGYLSYLSYMYLSGIWRGLALIVLSFFIILSIAAIIDFIISIFGYFVNKKGIYHQIIGFLKFMALMTSAIAAIYASVSQLV